MHEFSLATEIWQSVAQAAVQHGGGRVLGVKLEIGALNLLAEDQMRFWIETLAEHDGHPGVKVEITHLPGRVQCVVCGAETEVATPAGNVEHLLAVPLVCPACGAGEITVVGGREVRVVSAEIEPGATA